MSTTVMQRAHACSATDARNARGLFALLTRHIVVRDRAHDARPECDDEQSRRALVRQMCPRPALSSQAKDDDIVCTVAMSRSMQDWSEPDRDTFRVRVVLRKAIEVVLERVQTGDVKIPFCRIAPPSMRRRARRA